MEYQDRSIARNFAQSVLSANQLKVAGWVVINSDNQFYESHKAVFDDLSIHWGGVGQFAAKFNTKDQAVMRQRKFSKFTQMITKVKYFDGENVLDDEPIKPYN